MPRFVHIEELFKGWALRSQDRGVVRSLVPQLQIELSGSRGHDGRAWHCRGAHDDSAAGCSPILLISRSAGTAMRGRWLVPGGVTKPRMAKKLMRPFGGST